MNNLFAETRELSAKLQKLTGEKVGIAVEQGLASVISCRTEGRKTTRTYLTGWQSYGECIDFMRKLAD